ncbi:MAG: peptidase [Candidatus Accumulibacter sp.]|jgi:predicted metal-dependent peptidase|nr:peptidase [Accumulibacter sp.]
MSRAVEAKRQDDVATKNFLAGKENMKRHPIFAAMHVYIYRTKSYEKEDGLACVEEDGCIYCHPKARAEPEVWARVLAHCALHLGFRHFVRQRDADAQKAWNVACDLVVEKFLSDLKFGRPWYEHPLPEGIRDERRLFERFLCEGIAPEYLGFGTAGNGPDFHMRDLREKPRDWAADFAYGLGRAVKSAVNVAAGQQENLYDPSERHSPAQTAKDWFISSYPLLGAIASRFRIIEDAEICQRMNIAIAAISIGMCEIYINPQARLSTEALRFVMAHEFLHAALRHDSRAEWRDPYWWNVACDYVINGWLTEMGVGERPDEVLFDPQLKGMNAETVYERIVADMRRFRKLATLRGDGLGDILGEDAWWEYGEGVDLDAFYRRALAQGLDYHQAQGRGFLPEGLIEEIRALAHPPIPWDVELARWFDEFFAPLEKRRTYARLSRRQSAAPDIPLPGWRQSEELLGKRTYGVVLDTSGSMDRALLASVLGAIASYSLARDVPAARVVFCDAAAYDQGYLSPTDIAGEVKVKGRGGTVLQPGIDLLEHAEDFPKDAPLLIITDANCENRLLLHGREHAFLIPRGARLPFAPKGKVFRIR